MQLRGLMITGLTLMLVVGPAAAAPSHFSEATVHLPAGVLSQKSILALLLLLISHEEQEVHATLEALYESQYVSTAMEDRGDIERYLTNVMAARYKSTSSRTVFATMMKFQGLITLSFREPGHASSSNLRQGMIQVISTLPRASVDQFANKAGDWLTFLRDSLSRSGELSMIELQSLVSQRQRAIQLATNLLAALDEATKRVVSNMGDESAPAASTKTSKGGTAEQPSCPPCGCSCH